MGGAAVFNHPQPPRGDLVLHAVVQQDHAIGDVLFQPVPGQRAVATLAGDDRGHPAVLEPAEQAAQFGAQGVGIRQAGKQRLHGVQHDPFGAGLVDGMAETHEQAFQVVFAGFLDLAAFDADVIDHQLFRGDQSRHVETQRCDVVHQVLSGFLEAEQDTRFAEPGRAVHQERHAQQGLTRTGRATDQGWPAARDAAQQDIVKAGDPRWRLGKLHHAQIGFRQRHPRASAPRSFRVRRVASIRTPPARSDSESTYGRQNGISSSRSPPLGASQDGPPAPPRAAPPLTPRGALAAGRSVRV